MPEPWFHTELFGAFSAIAPVSGWVPFDFEVPYKTLYPVRPPQGTEWKQTGVEKWADLCLHSADGNAWRWFELKVRHVRREPDTQEFAHSAQLAFCKDVVALIGLEIESTMSYWKDYNEHTKAYRDKHTEGAKTLGTGTHHCVVAFVQLGLDQSPSHLNSMFTDKQSLLEVVDKLLNDGAKASGHPRACPDFSLKPLNHGGYSIVVCEWVHDV